MKMQTKSYIITKRIAKHGRQAVIVIPNVLSDRLPPQTLVRVTLDILDEDMGGEI